MTAGLGIRCLQGKEWGLRFVTLEKSTAEEDQDGSGIGELENVVQEAGELELEKGEDIPVRWIGCIEYFEEIAGQDVGKVFLIGAEVFKVATVFPCFPSDKRARECEVLEMLRFCRRLGRLVMFELTGEECYVFMDPTRIVDFVRQVTGPDKHMRGRLKQKDAIRLAKGFKRRAGGIIEGALK